MVISTEQLVSINVQTSRFRVFDNVFDADLSGRFGRAVQNSTLKELHIQGRFDVDLLLLREFVATALRIQGRHNADVTAMNGELSSRQ